MARDVKPANMLSDAAQKLVREHSERIVPELLRDRVFSLKDELMQDFLDKLTSEELYDQLAARLQRAYGRVNHFGGMAQVGRIDSSAVDFLQSGTGAIAEPTQTTLRRMVWAEQYGAAAAASAATNTTAIQRALTEVGSGRSGGTVLITTPGTYLLASAGTNPYQAGKQYCLDMAYDNVTLHIGPGVILKLADAQQTNAGGNVNIIAFRDRLNLTITGGGEIDGNATGQTGWTGGRLQTDGGLIVAHHASVLGNRNIRIERLTLRNSLSNAVWFRGGTPYSSYIYLDKLRVFACGEGPVVEKTEHLWMTDLYVDDTANVAVGDGIEPADCLYVVIDRCIVNGDGGGGAGTAFDLFGVKYCTLSNFIIREWATSGIDINKSSDGTEPTEIVVGPGVIEGVASHGIGLDGGKFNNVKIIGVVMDGKDVSTGNGIFVAADGLESTGPVTIENCSVRQFIGSGILIQTIKDVTVSGGQYNDNGAAGVRFQVVDADVADADIVRIVVRGVTATGNAAGGVSWLTQSFAGRPSGSITDCYLSGNTGGPIVTDENAVLNKMYVSGIYPSYASASQTWTPTILSGGAAVSRTYSTQVGRYRFLGDGRVWFQATVILSATGSSTGNTTIGGFPFTSRTTPANNYSAVTVFSTNTTYSGQLGALSQAGGVGFTIYNMTSGGALAALQETGLSATTAIIIQGVVEVADDTSLP